jgi:hypothetical protein
MQAKSMKSELLRHFGVKLNSLRHFKLHPFDFVFYYKMQGNSMKSELLRHFGVKLKFPAAL